MPADRSAVRIDALIFGGGVAGLWLLDELGRRGVSALLLETGSLGQGQTVASQGILHGGLKYTLQGLLTRSAAHIREMPALWRDCLAGRRQPDLSETGVRSQFCYLWRTDGVASTLGMIGARFGLRVAPRTIGQDDRPDVFAGCPGTVARLDEQVVSPAGMIANLARRNRERILRIADEVTFRLAAPGQVQAIELRNPQSGASLQIQPETVVFTAGAGNAALRERAGLSTDAMQLRPLHMVLARGDLPELNGHCVDGKKTRMTITSALKAECGMGNAENRLMAGNGFPPSAFRLPPSHRVWQIGGQVSEDGVRMAPAELIQHTLAELRAVLPGVDLARAEWATYRVNRAEGTTRNRRRPETIQVRREGNIVTAWPTKLVLAPKLAEVIADGFPPQSRANRDLDELRDWPRPTVALPPWEQVDEWLPGDGVVPARRTVA
jgi:glycine/D-amino acid oxidase-like deaminating enzyme